MKRRKGRPGSNRMIQINSNVSNRMILIHSNVSKFFKKQHTNTLYCFVNRHSLDGSIVSMGERFF